MIIEQEDINKLFEVDYPVMFEVCESRLTVRRLEHEEDSPNHPPHSGADAPQFW